jgi:hypothetical protein
MEPKHLVLAHVEKAVVVLVAALCAWYVISAFTDEAIRPKDINQADIAVKVDAIDKVLQSKEAPNLKAPPNYLDAMKERFARTLPKGAYVAWLTAHPDVGPTIEKGTYFYVYQLLPPTLVAKDNLGKLVLEIGLPKDTPSTERRISYGSAQTWKRSVDRGDIVNSAKHVAIQIETRVGSGHWRPLTGVPGVLEGGYVPSETLKKSPKLTIEAGSAWEQHSFRARTVAKVTGYDSDKESGDHTVLVHAGEMDEPDWNGLSQQVRQDPEFLKQFLKGSASALPPGVKLATGEAIFASGYSADASVRATSDIRFAFDKAISDPANPANEQGAFLVSKQFPDGWLEKPEVFKTDKGDVVGKDKTGKPRVLVRKGVKTEVPLETPFVLTEIQKGVSRIIYYEVEAKSRADGTKGKDLEVKPKTVTTDIAILKSTSGVSLKLTKLAKVTKPAKVSSFYTPTYDFKNGVYDEGDEFRKSPAEFVQQALEPPPPVKHAPGEGPLEALRLSTGEAIYSTDTDYFEMPDGRLIWWEPLNGLQKYPQEAKPEAGAPSKAEPAPVKPVVAPVRPPRPAKPAPTPSQQESEAPESRERVYRE